MKQIKKLNEQIEDTIKMINSTKEILEDNQEDEVLLFMLSQDESLLASLKEGRVNITLGYLRTNITSPNDLLNVIYSELPQIVDPKYIANQLGINVIKNDYLPDNEAGKCYIQDDITIEYKPQNTIYRENFSIAHELGHIVKHMSPANNTFTDSSELLYARNDYIDSLTLEEKEADEFAGYLLIPEESLNSIVDQLTEEESISASLISDIYKVSEGTVYHALKSRGIYYNPKILKDFSWL